MDAGGCCDGFISSRPTDRPTDQFGRRLADDARLAGETADAGRLAGRPGRWVNGA